MAACISTNQHPIGSLSTKASPDTNLMLTDVINASDQAKIHQQAELLDMWIALHGDNFYPRRKEKEKIAKELCMSYLQVNRWFANRRRKQTKKRKDEMLMTSSSHFTQPHSSSSSISNDNFKNNADEWFVDQKTERGSEEDRELSRMVINRASIIPEEANTLNSGSTSLKLRSDFKQDMSSSYSPSLNQMSSIGFEQVANIQRGVGVMCAGGDGSLRRDRQRFEQLLMNDVACNKLFGATRNVTDAAAPVPNALLDATSASDNTQLCAACTTTAPTTTSCVNPFVLAAAALSMQQQQNTTTQQPQFAWNANTNTSDEQQLNSSSYFQQLHAHAQQVMLLQQLITAQQLLSAATQSSSNQQHADQQWLSQSLSQPSATNFNVNLLRRGSLSSSTASSYASSSSCASSPILLNNSDEEISELSAQSQQTDHDTTSPFRETVLSSQDDDRFMMDSLIELRKDLSEKESIAVAVLAGMAACQR